MQTTDISISPEQYELIKNMPMHGPESAETYVEENIINEAVKCGYGFYGLEKIEPDKVTILIGDSCD